MKIEKINDNQIRCTLTKEDLASREIKLSELAYGSEKTRDLFRDMMEQAANECGFDATNAPLMIEAIPLSPESIVLIVTKVDDPEELDSRFSRFSAEDAPESVRKTKSVNLSEMISGADDILNLIKKISDAKKKAAQETKNADHDDTKASDKKDETKSAESKPDAPSEPIRLTRFYLFSDLETVIQACRAAGTDYQAANSLFKNPEDQRYYLLLQMADTDPAKFNKICNILSEYGLQVSYTVGMEEYFTEHMEVIISEEAIQRLSVL